VEFGDRIIRAININPEGVVIEYLDATTDVRKNGLTRNHVVFVPFGEDYDTELEELIDSAQRALSDALEDFDVLDPSDPRDVLRGLDQDDEEDEPDYQDRDGGQSDQEPTS
jgi:hypothetical protein